MTRLSLFFDAAEQFWQDWVVSYDLDRQIVLASRMDESARRHAVPLVRSMRALGCRMRPVERAVRFALPWQSASASRFCW